MEITTVVGCPNECPYCPQDLLTAAYAKRSSIRIMTFDVFKTCVDKFPANDGVWFAGMAEPWLNPECTRMALYAHQTGRTLGVFTTLVGMKPADVRLLEQIPFHAFCVHILSHRTKEVLSDVYMKTLDALSSSKIKASYYTHNKDPHPEIASLLGGKGISIAIQKVHDRARNIRKPDVPKSRKKWGVLRCSRDLRCTNLLPNGDVLLCCMDWRMHYVLGNLLKSDYETLFRSETFMNVKRALRKNSSDVLCRYCCFSEDYLSRLKVRVKRVARGLGIHV